MLFRSKGGNLNFFKLKFPPFTAPISPSLISHFNHEMLKTSAFQVCHFRSNSRGISAHRSNSTSGYFCIFNYDLWVVGNKTFFFLFVELVDSGFMYCEDSEVYDVPSGVNDCQFKWHNGVVVFMESKVFLVHE